MAAPVELTASHPHRFRSKQSDLLRIAGIVAGVFVVTLILWQSLATLWGGLGPALFPQWQTPASMQRQRSQRFQISSQVRAEIEAMFQQVALDFAPFRKTNITLEMVEQAYCACRRSGFRFQVVNNRMYVAGEVEPWQTRQAHIKKQLLDLYRVDGKLPEVDIYFGSTDYPERCEVDEMPSQCRNMTSLWGAARQRGPHFQHTKTQEHDWTILHPDETFAGWPESKIGPWSEIQQVLALAGTSYPWEMRNPALFFAGANLGFQRQNASQFDFKAHNEGQVDIRWVNWGDPKTLIPLHEFCQFRHLLHMAGCSWSSRLKYLMLCRSAVVIPASPYLEFWYRALMPGKNFFQIPELVSPESGMHIIRAAETLRNDEAFAHRLAAAAQDTVLHTLSSDNIREYWRRILHTYAELQTFKPTLHPDAIPLHASISHPLYVAPEHRTCKICPHPSWDNYHSSFCPGIHWDPAVPEKLRHKGGLVL